MSSRRTSWNEDRGASLALALVFLMVLSLSMLALLSFSHTSLRATTAVASQRGAAYSSSSAIDAAVTAVRGDRTLGRDSSLYPASCPTQTVALNGVTTEVVCSGEPGSGVGGGSGVTSSNSPPNALLTLASLDSGEGGLYQKSNNDLNIRGRLAVNSTVGATAGNTVVQGESKVRGACVGLTAGTDSPAPECGLGTASITDSDDPAYPLWSGHPASPSPAALPVGCPTPGAQRLVVFSPGYYDSAPALNEIFARCSGGVFWFKPGFYYFDFQGADTLWRIGGLGTQVVGGTPMRWTPAAPAAGAPRPAVPWPANDSTPRGAGGGETSEESATAAGVQFAFGGTSRMQIEHARVELCASASTTEQEIAVYGVTPAQATTTPAPPPAAFTQAALASSTGATASDPVFSAPEKASPAVADSEFAILADTKNPGDSTATLTLSDFGSPPAVPAGATVTDVRLRVTQRPDRVTSLGLVVTPGNGGAPTAFGHDSGNNCTSVTALCSKTAPSAYSQFLQLPPAFRDPAVLTGSKVDLTATVTTNGGNQGFAAVDVVAFEIRYTVPAVVPYRSLAGCASLGCTLITTLANGGADETDLALQGTLYAPTAKLDLTFKKSAGSVFQRGVIARSVEIQINPNSTFAGSPFQLPLTGPAGTNRRTVVFTARQGGIDVLRAKVQFDDVIPAQPGRTADVVEWGVLR